MKYVYVCCLILFACSEQTSAPEFIFTRLGVAIKGTYSDVSVQNHEYSVHQIGNHTLLKFIWEAGGAYTFKVEGKTYTHTAPQQSSPALVAKIPIGNVNAEIKLKRSIDTDIAISADHRFVAIGSYLGTLYVYDLQKNTMLWSKTITEGVAKKVMFSADSKSVLVGEQSMDGTISCFDVVSGEKRWSYAIVKDVEQSAPPRSDDKYGIYTLPGVFHIEQMNDGFIVSGVHSWIKKGKPQKRSKLYYFKNDGTLKWSFPNKKALGGTILYFDATSKFITFNMDEIQQEYKVSSPVKEQSVVLLDTETGQLLDQKTIKPLPPYFPSVYFWQSVSISGDNSFVNMGAYDGRGFIFPINGNRFGTEKTLVLGQPVIVNNIPITAGIPYTSSVNSHAIYSVVQTSVPYAYASANNISEPPSLHPAAGTLFFYDKDGNIVWKFNNGLIHSAVHSSKSGEWLIATLDNKKENRDEHQFGMSVFRYSSEYSYQYTYNTEGFAYFRGALSADGMVMGITETPFVGKDNETMIGTYQVHIVL